MFDNGCYIIYHAAGSSGNGVIKEAKDRALNGEDVWVIGVDRDQYEEGIYKDDKSVILTSMVKRVDNASYIIATEVAKGEFKGGVRTFGLKEDGVASRRKPRTSSPANSPLILSPIASRTKTRNKQGL